MIESVGIPDGLIGSPSLEPLKVNLCDALLDSGLRLYNSLILVQEISGRYSYSSCE